MRLDEFLVKKHFVSSRERAKELVKNGSVNINGKTASKPSANVSGDEKIEITSETLKYVGRGGLKLEKALSVFRISLEGRKCADFGASTGGFTDCMLQNGAAEVYAVDVGHGQLHHSLASNKRVHNIEGLNIREISAPDLKGSVSFIGCDLSFISLKLILPNIRDSLDEDGEAVILIKPQFEAGRENIGKNGIVKSEKIHVRVLEDISREISFVGLILCGLDFSPVAGGSGNIEYLAHISKNKNADIKGFDIKSTVKNAFEKL